MYAVIYDEQNQEQARYALNGDELLDCDLYLERYLEQIGIEGTYESSDFGGHYWVVLQEEVGSVVCWTSQYYFLNDDCFDC